jgi:hypothetical protein
MCKKIQRPKILGRSVRLKVNSPEKNGDEFELEEFRRRKSLATNVLKGVEISGVTFNEPKLEMIPVLKHSVSIGGGSDISEDNNFALSMSSNFVFRVI